MSVRGCCVGLFVERSTRAAAPRVCRDAPRWVQLVMRNGFRSPFGVLAIAGLSGCPLWLFARSCLRPGTWLTTPAWALVLVPGRLLAAAVECWVVQRRMQQLTTQDAAAYQRLEPS
jgi:hypothetical protein